MSKVFVYQSTSSLLISDSASDDDVQLELLLERANFLLMPDYIVDLRRLLRRLLLELMTTVSSTFVSSSIFLEFRLNKVLIRFLGLSAVSSWS